MKYIFLASFLVIVLVSCKSSEGLKSSNEEMNTTLTNAWTQVDFKPEQGMILPNGYTTYLLDLELFTKQLEEGGTLIPNEAGEFVRYEVKNSGTMSPELQAKFPNIKSYVGNAASNSLCQARIDQNDAKLKVLLLCNDGSIYLQELYNPGIYFIYNKKNLPEGVGTVNE